MLERIRSVTGIAAVFIERDDMYCGLKCPALPRNDGLRRYRMNEGIRSTSYAANVHHVACLVSGKDPWKNSACIIRLGIF
jgi:hypothetical protein